MRKLNPAEKKELQQLKARRRAIADCWGTLPAGQVRAEFDAVQSRIQQIVNG